MDIFNGKCVICSEETLVLSGKDKQRFVELLKEHYFDVNQIKDNKFLLQFKEKRTEKSICLSCAYIIDSYVSTRNKCKESTRAEKKCSICNKETNLTNGTNQLLNDANNLLKNVDKNKKRPRLNKQICLDCCFCIISWNKIQNIITNYTLNAKKDSNALNGIKKRKHSAEDDVDSESDSEEIFDVKNNKIPGRTTRRSTVTTNAEKEIKNEVSKEKKLKEIKNSLNWTSPRNNKKSKFAKPTADELEENLKHLSNVNTEILSKNIKLKDKITKKIIADDRMMFDIPYISFEVNNSKSMSESRREQSDTEKIGLKSRRKASVVSEIQISPMNKNKRKKAAPNSSNNDNHSSEVIEEKKKKYARKNNVKDVIEISDTELELIPVQNNTKGSANKTPTRISSRITKGKSALNLKDRRKIVKKSIEKKLNKCSSCYRTFAKKYNLKLHELQHETSFKPVVVVDKENELNSETTDKTSSDNTDIEDNQYAEKEKKDSSDSEKDSNKDDSDETQFDENLKQAVDATLSQLEKDIDESSAESVEKENDKHEPTLDEEKEKETNGYDETSQDEDPLKLDDISDDVEENDENKENKKESDNEENINTVAESEKVQAESKPVNEHLKNKKTNKKNDDIEIINEDSKDESQQSEGENSVEMKEKNNDDVSQQNGKENKNDNEIQTNGETNDINFNKAESEERDKENEENSAAVGNKDDSDVVNIIDSDGENDELKKDDINNVKSVLIEDDASNSSDKNEDIDKQTAEKGNYEHVVIDNCSSNSHENKEDVNDKFIEENNPNPLEIEDESSNNSGKDTEKDKSIDENNKTVVIEDESSNNSDKDTEKDKSIEENNKSIVIEDESSNKSDKNESQNSEDSLNKTPNSLINEDSQIESAKDVLEGKQKTHHSDNIEKESHESDSEYECESTNSQSTDKINNCVQDEDCDMESLKISPECENLSSQKNRELIDKSISGTNSDKYEIVENLLQNLGA